jgi:hypothetical protein
VIRRKVITLYDLIGAQGSSIKIRYFLSSQAALIASPPGPSRAG